MSKNYVYSIIIIIEQEIILIQLHIIWHVINLQIFFQLHFWILEPTLFVNEIEDKKIFGYIKTQQTHNRIFVIFKQYTFKEWNKEMNRNCVTHLSIIFKPKNIWIEKDSDHFMLKHWGRNCDWYFKFMQRRIVNTFLLIQSKSRMSRFEKINFRHWL